MNQITINSKVLKETLDKVLSCVNTSNSFHAICEFIKFTADEEDSYLEVTDMKNHIRCKIDFKPDVKGSLLVSHIELVRYLKLLPDCPVYIKKHATKPVVNVVAAEELVEIPSDMPENFPLLENIATDDKISVNRLALKRSVEKAFPFTDTDKSMVMNNFLLSTDGEGLLVYSTNRHICYKNEIECEGKFGRHSFNTDIRLMLSVIDEETIEISVSKYKFQIKSDTYLLQGVLFSDRFPPVEDIFRTYPDRSFKIEKDLFDSVMKKAEIFSSHVIHRVRLAFNGQLMISSADTDLNKSFDTQIPYKSEDDMDLVIGFNIGLLLKLIKVEEGNELNFLYKNNMSPVYLTSGKEVALIMPMDIS